MMGSKKTIDFAYWGKMKVGDDRGKIIRQIYRDPDISTVLVGGFPSGVQRQAAWIKDWKQLYPMLEPAKCTLCFNWQDTTATTSRYPEALSIGIIPFVWKDYDRNNTYNIDSWQRVRSFEEFKEKVLQLKDVKRIEEYRENYKKVLLSENEYFEEFSNKMNNFILW